MDSIVTIRDAENHDFTVWKVLWDGYNASYGRVGPTALLPEMTLLTWSRLLDDDEPMHCLLATRAGRLLGLAHFLYHRSTTLMEPVCYLQDLFTTEESRGKGVGRALIAAVVERAKAAGSQRVYWQTRETNKVAMRLYDQVADKSGIVVYRIAL